MLDFETPTYVTAKEAQHLQSQVNILFLPQNQNALTRVQILKEAFCLAFCCLLMSISLLPNLQIVSKV